MGFTEMVLEHQVTLRNDTVIMLVFFLLLLLLLLFPFSSSIPVPAGFGYRPPMLQKSPEKVSELYTLHLTTSISYVMTYVFHYHADADFLKDCGGGEWLGDDPTG